MRDDLVHFPEQRLVLGSFEMLQKLVAGDHLFMLAFLGLEASFEFSMKGVAPDCCGPSVRHGSLWQRAALSKFLKSNLR